MNLTTTNLQINKAFTDVYDALSGVSIDELNIYNQAFLELNQPLVKNSVFHKKTKYEIPVVMSVSGDLDGQIICLLDVYNKNVKESEQDFFKSLYIESMNILIGKMMTDLEIKYAITGIMSAPRVPKDNFLDLVNMKASSLSMGYKLISNSVEYDCRIIFNLNKKKNIEV